MPAASDALSVNPSLGAAVAHSLLRTYWAIDAQVSNLGSLQDQNLRVTTSDGQDFVLKVAGRHLDRAELELENEALRHVVGRREGFSSPAPIRTLAGEEIVEVEGLWIRLLTWVAGETLDRREHLDLDDLRLLGRSAARVSGALRDFASPALDRPSPWDPRRGDEVATRLLDEMTDRHLQELIAAALEPFEALEGRERLPLAVVHGDVTPANATLVTGPDGYPVTGVLDFGDIMRTWRVGDIAATAVGIAEHRGVDDVLDAVLAALQGYHSVAALSQAEVGAFWPLVLSRAAANATMTHVQASLSPDNDYAADAAISGRRALEALMGVPAELAAAASRTALGLEIPAVPYSPIAEVEVEIVAGLNAGEPDPMDLSVDSPLYSCGEWLDGDRLAAVFPQSGVSLGRWGECRLLGDASRPAELPPNNLHLGVDVFAAQGTPAYSPVSGTVVRASEREVILELASPDGQLYLRLVGLDPISDLQPGTRVSSGSRIGAISARSGLLPTHLHVQLQVCLGLPTYGTERHRAAWLSLCPDPSGLLGVRATAPPPVPALEHRRLRAQTVAAPQHLYYSEPVEMVRGWRHFLYDAEGRGYLDMINNIAGVGHSHPKITEAATRQFRRLNTNSRFLYDSMTRYSARVAELLPPDLDTVFLVNSGSEAADLAIQLARVFTGRRDLIAIQGAYHGWTSAVLEVSTSPGDRPRWREDLAPFVHVVDQPDSYRGAFGDDAEAYRQSVQNACDGAEARGGVAAFLAEPLLGNQGAVELVKGYLRSAFATVRAAGGLCIADEVQVGLARTGDFWAFEHEDAVPDIVYTAKATGNGHPLGVVACRKEIADAFDARMSFFSSTGGGPVSCEIGIAVLDVIRDEGLQRNAQVVGGHLKHRLQALSDAHPLVGAVHGRGLYLGVDLVRDRATKEPAPEDAHAVCERLRGLGVVIQPTGDALNVLKVKPPLCIDIEAADYFVTTLDRVLREHGQGRPG